MANIFEPKSEEFTASSEKVPTIELLPGKLRMHFHLTGISFGLIDPINPNFSMMISYDEAYKIMVAATKK